MVCRDFRLHFVSKMEHTCVDSLLCVLQSLSQQYLFVALFKYRELIMVPLTQHKPASRHRMIFFGRLICFEN